VGRIVGPVSESADPARRRLRVDVEQRVKGDLPRELEILAPAGTDCDLPERTSRSIGLLLGREPDGTLVGNLCSIANPGRLVVAGGEPRGGVIKVFIGFVILGLVILWSYRRLKRGARPDLPGAPRP